MSIVHASRGRYFEFIGNLTDAAKYIDRGIDFWKLKMTLRTRRMTQRAFLFPRRTVSIDPCGAFFSIPTARLIKISLQDVCRFKGTKNTYDRGPWNAI